jgi:ribosomal protein S6
MEEAVKDYELLCILSPKAEGEDLDKAKNSISETINRLEGTINFKESSKKPLAYPINKEKQGIFLISQISIIPEKLIELSKELKANKQILRHLINQLIVQTEQQRTITSKKPAIRPRKTVIKKEQPETEKPSGETLEEIDKKLDQIIGDI